MAKQQLNNRVAKEKQEQEAAATKKKVDAQAVISTRNSCIQKAKNRALDTFQTVCASETSSEEQKDGCYTATFEDFTGFVQYEMTKYSTSETERLWDSYQTDLKNC